MTAIQCCSLIRVNQFHQVMVGLNFIILASMVLTLNEGVESLDCSKTIKFNMLDCCDMPIPKDEKQFDEIAKRIYGSTKNHFYGECKVNEEFYDSMKYAKGGEIDVPALEKRVEEQIKEAPWRNILKLIAKQCYERLKPNVKEFQMKIGKEPFNVKPEDCDGRLLAYNTCETTEAFLKCPEDDWTENKVCAEARRWIKDCGKDVAFLIQFADL